GFVSAVSDVRECDDAVASGSQDSDTGVVAGAEERDLHSRDTLAGRALHNELEVSGKKGSAAKKNEKGNANAIQLSSSQRKGLYESSRRSPDLRVAIGIARTAAAFPFAQWPFAKNLAYSCAAARDLHPLPSSAPAAERANLDGRSGKNDPGPKRSQGESLTLSA